ncbi:uncharacterized protein [Halyomorpha halys]|uniref:uncharacterized protein n=1 Tax=Halyomorpha halys TaxID=286706 RepID=UPI0034D350FA
MKAFVFIFALVAACAAVELDLDELENELIESPLVDYTGSSSRRSLGSLFRKSCSCEGITCGCCASPSVYGATVNGCIKFTPNTEEKKINIGVTAYTMNVLDHSFSTSDYEQYCSSLPGRASFLNYCFKSVTSGDEQTGINFCSQLDVKVKSVTAVSINFRCVDLKDGKLSFSENTLPGSNGVFDIKARQVFRKVVEWFKS